MRDAIARLLISDLSAAFAQDVAQALRNRMPLALRNRFQTSSSETFPPLREQGLVAIVRQFAADTRVSPFAKQPAFLLQSTRNFRGFTMAHDSTGNQERFQNKRLFFPR